MGAGLLSDDPVEASMKDAFYGRAQKEEDANADLQEVEDNEAEVIGKKKKRKKNRKKKKKEGAAENAESNAS